MSNITTKPRSILFINGCMHTESSGPYLTLKQTAATLVNHRHNVAVIGTRRPDVPIESITWPCENHAFCRFGPDSLHYSPKLSTWLKNERKVWDVVSMQGVWMHVNHAAANWCNENKIPFMITGHGNFNPLALRISSWKKFFAKQTFMRNVFDQVSCFQALTNLEYQSMREYGITKPICVIGNGINIPSPVDKDWHLAFIPSHLAERRTCLYLGRLHPIKGIDRLLQAWAQVVPDDNWQLIICGDGSHQYRNDLENLSKKLNCRNVTFVGFVNGDLKAAWFRMADFIVLPSHSEAFAMSVMEAFSYGTPALMTSGCGFPEAMHAGAAVEVASEVAAIADGLSKMLRMTPSEIKLMGIQALRFVENEYSWEKVCGQLESVYDWLCDGGVKPSCLRFD